MHTKREAVYPAREQPPGHRTSPIGMVVAERVAAAVATAGVIWTVQARAPEYTVRMATGVAEWNVASESAQQPLGLRRRPSAAMTRLPAESSSARAERTEAGFLLLKVLLNVPGQRFEAVPITRPTPSGLGVIFNGM